MGPPLVRPIVVTGAPFSGVQLVAWSLAQHPALTARLDDSASSDLLLAVTSVHRIVATTLPRDVIGPLRTALRAEPGEPPDHEAMVRSLTEAVMATVVDGTSNGGIRPLLAGSDLAGHFLHVLRVFPGAQFVHVVRNVESAVAAAADA